MSSLRNIDHAADRELTNRAFTIGVLAIDDSNTENVQTTAAVVFSINGVLYSKAAVAEIDVSGLDVLDESGAETSMTAQVTATDRIYLLILDSGGNIKVVQGEAVATGETCYCPVCPPDHAAFGAVKVANATGSDFTFGTTGLDTSGITDTYYNLSIPPVSL